MLAVILNLTPYGRFKVFLVVFFACCCLTQFCYMKYFGSWLTPYAVNFIFLEFSDILLEAKSIWRDYVFLVVLVGLPYFLLLFLWKWGIIRQFSFRYYPLLYILFFGYFFYQASTPEGIFQMLFKNTCCTAYNTINSFSAFFANVLPLHTTPVSTDFSSVQRYAAKQTVERVYNSSTSKDMLDECPMVYKNMTAIMRNIISGVDVVKIIRRYAISKL